MTKSKKKKKVKAKDFDEAFDRGDDVTEHLDLSTARRVNTQVRRVNVDFPEWVIASLDKEARRIGISRQSLLKMWIADRLDQAAEDQDLSTG